MTAVVVKTRPEEVLTATAAVFRRLARFATGAGTRVQLNLAIVALWGRIALILDTVETVMSQGHERLFHIDATLGRALKEGDAVLVRQVLSSLRRNDTLVGHIALVAYQNSIHICGGIRLEVGHPHADVVE